MTSLDIRQLSLPLESIQLLFALASVLNDLWLNIVRTGLQARSLVPDPRLVLSLAKSTVFIPKGIILLSGVMDKITWN